MLNFVWMLATVSATGDPFEEPKVVGETTKLWGYNMRDMLLLAGIAFTLAAALFLYAYVTRKKHRATIALTNPRAIYRTEPEEDSDRRRYRKKRRRRGHPEFLPRNPTLQETGGLPPLRPDEPPAEPTQ